MLGSGSLTRFRYTYLGLTVELHKREIHGIGGDTVDGGVCLAKTFALLVEAPF